MKMSFVRFFAFAALSVGGLAATLACASLLVGLSWSDGLVRYPTARRLAATDYRLETLAKGYFSQDSAYQTAEPLPKVLGWYVRSLGLGQRDPYGASGGCLTLSKFGWQWFIQQALAITLCSQPHGTIVFVSRSLIWR